MPITSIETDKDALTITIVADYPVDVQRLWDAYADPRQLEQFWGPPGWPSTFHTHDFTAGGRSAYAMNGPDGEVAAGYWEFVAVDPPRSFTVEDGFANADGTPNTDMPTSTMEFHFSATPVGSQLKTVSHFGSRPELEELLGMGMLEGTQESMGQIDAVLAEDWSV